MELLMLDPVAFTLGPLTVYWYGLIISLAILIGMMWAIYEGKKRGIDPDTFVDMLIIIIPVAILCARLYYVIFSWSSYAGHPVDAFKIWEGGLAIHGALIGGVMTAYLLTRKQKVPFWLLADVVAPSIMLGQIMGRWGNFFNQEAYGSEVSKSFLENLHLPDFIINQMYINGAYYHPTFLYESLWNVVGLVLVLLYRRSNQRVGESFLLYVIWYSVGRFFIESLRTDSLMFFGLKTAQLVSLALIIGSVIVWIYRRKISTVRYMDVQLVQGTSEMVEAEKKE